VGKQVASGKADEKNSFSRQDLHKAKRVVIKVGTSVLTRGEEFGISLTHLASLVEQVCKLVHEGREVIIVTSGAVGFGKMRLQVQSVMSQTVRNTLSWGANSNPLNLDSRACAATGQSGLMTLYDAMFSQYGVSIAQILVTMSDFQVDAHRANMCETIRELISLGIVPVCNENDVFYSNTASSEFIMSHQNTRIETFNPNWDRNQATGEGGDQSKVVRLTANDSLSALLAVELQADLMITLSSVDGIYTAPPGRLSSMGTTPKLLNTLNPSGTEFAAIEFGRDQRVGRGGMAAKVDAAKFALNHGVHVVLANGLKRDVLDKILLGKTEGTLFTNAAARDTAPHVKAAEARSAGKAMAYMNASHRKKILEDIAKDISKKTELLISANTDDMAALGTMTPQDGPLRDLKRYTLNKRKLESVVTGIEQMAFSAANSVGRNLKWCKVTDGLYLEQEAVPMGVVLCVYEAEPDIVPQVAALCIASGNAALFKSQMSTTPKTAEVFHSIVITALKNNGVSPKAIMMLDQRDDLEEYLGLTENVDLVIPRGSSQLIDYISHNTKIPVLGDAEGLCHVYVHSDADFDIAQRVILDSKCETSRGHYAMETLLLHSSWMDDGRFEDLIAPLIKAGVTVHSGPRLRAQYKAHVAKLAPARSFQEFGAMACAVEVVSSLEDAIEHINEFGSNHTDVVVSEDELVVKQFSREIESACVFVNASTRLSDGFVFGLGAEVGVSTRKGPLRGPVGIEGLMTAKWTLKGRGHGAADFASGDDIYIHEKKCVTCGLQVRDN